MASKKKKKKVKLSTHKTTIKVDNFMYMHIDNLTHQSKNIFNSYLYYANHFYKFKPFLINYYQNGELSFPSFSNNLILHFKRRIEWTKELANYIFPFINIKYIGTTFLPNHFNSIFKREKINIRNQFIIEEHDIYDTILVDEVIYRALMSVFYKKKYEIKTLCDKFTVLNENQSFYWDYLFRCKIIKLDYSKEGKNIESNDCNCIKKIVRMHIDDTTSSLHSDIQCNVLDKAIDSFKSFWAKREKGLKASKPSYLEKNGNFIITFNSDKNIIKNKNDIQLRLGNNANYENYIKVSRYQGD